MRKTVMMTASVLLVGVVGIPTAVRGMTIPIGNHTPESVKKNCQGGTYFAPSAYGVYGCLAGDGSGIVCGGTGKDKKTCGTWGPTLRILPTQSQVREAETKEKAEAAGK
jgi:hypothetical protein